MITAAILMTECFMQLLILFCRIAEDGRNLWRSSSPPTLRSNLGQLYQVVQGHIQLSVEYLQGWGLHNYFGQPVFDHPRSKKNETPPPTRRYHNPQTKTKQLLCLNGISCILIYACCLLSCHLIPLRRVWHDLLYSPISDISIL